MVELCVYEVTCVCVDHKESDSRWWISEEEEVEEKNKGRDWEEKKQEEKKKIGVSDTVNDVSNWEIQKHTHTNTDLHTQTYTLTQWT